MSTIGDAKDGLVIRLRTISGLHVFGDPPQSVNEFPAAVVLTSDLEVESAAMGNTIHFGSNTLQHQLRVLLLLDHPGSDSEGWDELDSYVSPTGGKSIQAAIEGDLTLGGKVDDAEVLAVRSIGPQQFQGASYYSAEFLVNYMVTVVSPRRVGAKGSDAHGQILWPSGEGLPGRVRRSTNPGRLLADDACAACEG